MMPIPPRYCCVFQCLQKGPLDKYGNKVTYHLVPSAQPMRKLWIQKIRRRDYLYKSVANIYVCSLHFKPDDFAKADTYIRRKLIEGAVPSKFRWPAFKEQQTEQSTTKRKQIVGEEIISSMEKIEPSLSRSFVENTQNNEVEPAGNTNERKMGQNKDAHETLSKKNMKWKKSIAKCKYLKNKLGTIALSLDLIKDNDEDICFYTGFPNYCKLMVLYNFLNPSERGENILWWKERETEQNSTSPAERPRKMDLKDQFLCVLMQLKLGLFVKDLAYRFGVSESVISTTCISWIHFMYLQLGQVNIWPTREQVDLTMPNEFKEKYPTTRVIIEVTEIKCEVSKSLVLQTATYANHKSCKTYKGLIGISPEGAVTFVSSLFAGKISDEELTKKSGFLDMEFSENDSVMANKGFLIEDLLKNLSVDVSLNIPPCLSDKGQFTKEKLSESQKIEKLRVYMERRLNRMKRFHIFDQPIPITLSPVINQIWTVVALLTNFQNPIINLASSSTFDSSEDIDDYTFDFNLKSLLKVYF